MEQIKEIHKKNRQTYGSRKITAELRRSGRLVNHKRVVRLMKKAGICSKLAKKYKATTNSKHSLPVAENILNREFAADRPNPVSYTHLDVYKRQAIAREKISITTAR